MNSSKSQNDDEVRVIDVLDIIWHWKTVALSIVGLSVIISGIYVFSLPKVYTCTMIVKPADFVLNGDIQKRSIVNSANIVDASSTALQKTLNFLKLSGNELYQGGHSLKVRPNKKKKIVRMDYDCYNTEQGIRILETLISYLSTTLEDKANYFIEKQELSISKKDIQLKGQENQIKTAKTHNENHKGSTLKEIEFLKRQQKKYQREAEELKEFIERMKNERIKLDVELDELLSQSKSVSKEGRSLNLAFLLDAKTARYYEREYKLKLQLSAKENRLAKNYIQQKTLLKKRNDVENDYLQFKNTIELSMSALENKKEILERDLQRNKNVIEIVKYPTAISNSVKPNKKKAIFLVFISSLIISLITVFSIEYVIKQKERMAQR